MWGVVFLLPVLLADCSSKEIIAFSDASQFEVAPGVYRHSVIVPPVFIWTSIEGARWVWVTTEGNLAPGDDPWPFYAPSPVGVGEFKFISSFVIPERDRSRISAVTLYIAADEFYAVDLNGELIAPRWTSGWTQANSYELKDKFIGALGDGNLQENLLEIYVANPAAFGGLIFKVEISY